MENILQRYSCISFWFKPPCVKKWTFKSFWWFDKTNFYFFCTFPFGLKDWHSDSHLINFRERTSLNWGSGRQWEKWEQQCFAEPKFVLQEYICFILTSKLYLKLVLFELLEPSLNLVCSWILSISYTTTNWGFFRSKKKMGTSKMFMFLLFNFGSNLFHS